MSRWPVLLLALLTPALLAGCVDRGPPPGGRIERLEHVDLKQGTGTVAAAGDEVTVHYSGWLHDQDAPQRRGERFDSSVDRGEPLTFLLGAGRVIRGWDEGVAGMREGGTRVLLIPPEYGYGRRGAGGAIPPHASLVFEVQLLEVRPHRSGRP